MPSSLSPSPSSSSSSSCVIIDGKAAAARIDDHVKTAVSRLRAERGFVPGLAVVLVGDDPASEVYVASKNRRAEAAGMLSRQIRLPADIGFDALISCLDALNADDDIDGVLLQMPLPSPLDAAAAIARIDPGKDVDGLTAANIGLSALGRPALIPCTPLGTMMLLDDVCDDLAGAVALVIGRSILVGKPAAQLLLARHCTVTIAHSRSRDLPKLCGEADIVVAAVGIAQFVKGDWLKPGSIVIDVGINRSAPSAPGGKARLVGDVDFDSARQRAGALTPVPGGVGPMTVACLLVNALKAACLRRGVDFAALCPPLAKFK